MSRRATLLCTLLLVCTTAAPACDFCGGGDMPTYQGILDEAGAAAIARLDGRLPDGWASYRIVSVLKGKAKTDDVVDVPTTAILHPRFVYLLWSSGEDLAGADAIVTNEVGAAFAKRVAGLPAPDPEDAEVQRVRLAFFVEHLPAADAMIAASARQGCATAPYAAMKELRPRPDPAELLRWLTEARTHRQNLGAILMVLGACGSREHLPRLEEMLVASEWQGSGAYDALLATYLVLRGAEGLPRLREIVRLDLAAGRHDRARPFARALGFHGRYEEVLSREQVLGALRELLASPDSAEASLTELASLEDWDSLPQVIELYTAHRESHPWLIAPVVRYLRACPGPEAAAHLEALGLADDE